MMYKCQCGCVKEIPQAIGCNKCMQKIHAEMEKKRIVALNGIWERFGASIKALLEECDARKKKI